MRKSTENLIVFLGVAMFIIMLGLAFAPVLAHGTQSHNHGEIVNNIDNSTTNNYITESAPAVDQLSAAPLTITEGVSDTDLARGIVSAMAAGGHQFDYSTTDWQASINTAWQISDEEENAVSFGLGKRFESLGKTLLHGSYTENGSRSWVGVGATFRF